MMWRKEKYQEKYASSGECEKNRNTKKYSTCGDSEEKKKKYQTNYIIVLYEGSTPSRGKQYDGADVSQLQAVRAVAVKGALRQGAPRRPRHWHVLPSSGVHALPVVQGHLRHLEPSHPPPAARGGQRVLPSRADLQVCVRPGCDRLSPCTHPRQQPQSPAEQPA